MPYETTRALVATLHLNSTTARARHGWDAVASSALPSDLAAALAAVHAQCTCSHATAAAFGAPEALPALCGALGQPPASRQAFPPWLEALGLLQRGLAAPAALPTDAVFQLLAAIVPGVVAVLARWSPGSAAEATRAAFDGLRSDEVRSGTDLGRVFIWVAYVLARWSPGSAAEATRAAFDASRSDEVRSGAPLVLMYAACSFGWLTCWRAGARAAPPRRSGRRSTPRALTRCAVVPL